MVRKELVMLIDELYKHFKATGWQVSKTSGHSKIYRGYYGLDAEYGEIAHIYINGVDEKDDIVVYMQIKFWDPPEDKDTSIYVEYRFMHYWLPIYHSIIALADSYVSNSP